MSKGVLWTIKIVAIFITVAFMTGSKMAGVPILITNIIGLAIIVAIWKYKPDESKDKSDEQELDKS
jgi:hypothetical protein